MVNIQPFKAIRPKADLVDQVASLPYDVMNRKEAEELVQDNPYSYLRIDRSEVDLPEVTDVYAKEVYQKAKSNLGKLVTDNICAEDAQPCIYIYRQIMNGRSQTGLVGCAGADDYLNNKIKKHEFTRADKEAERTNHIDICDANTGPIF